MKFHFIGLFLLVFVFASYAQERYLLIRSGGGVTGSAIAYKISLDGTVLKGNGVGEINYMEKSKLKKCAVKKYFKNARALMASSPDFNHPGNIYSSITLHEEGKESKITWGAPEHEAPEDAKKLYQKINSALARLTFTTDTRK